MEEAEDEWLIIYVGIQSPIFRSGHLHLAHAADSESIRTQSHLLRFGDPLQLRLRPGWELPLGCHPSSSSALRYISATILYINPPARLPLFSTFPPQAAPLTYIFTPPYTPHAAAHPPERPHPLHARCLPNILRRRATCPAHDHTTPRCRGAPSVSH